MTKRLEDALAINPDFQWTLERYHYAITNGTFTEQDRIELLYGKIYDLMPAGSPHEESVSLLAEFFRSRFGTQYRYREEKSLFIQTADSAPEPDFAVVAKKSYASGAPVPGEVYFIAEVASSSLAKDRGIKAQLYAEANLPEYWIINLVDRQVEVYLQPHPEQGRYRSVNLYTPPESFTSPFAGRISVEELLPEESV